MLKETQKVALYMEGHLFSDYGKMGFGVLRYLKNPIVGVIDSNHSGTTVNALLEIPSTTPVVKDLQAAAALGAEVLILGIAPSGGKFQQTGTPS